MPGLTRISLQPSWMLEEIDQGSPGPAGCLLGPDPRSAHRPEEGEPMDVLSRPLKIYEGLERKRFATFSEALDAFFVE